MNRSSNVRRRAQQLRRERAREQGDGSTATLRLLVCGVIFVLLVAAKLLFPEAVSGVTRSAGQLIGRNADFKEAFAAMGRAISGEEPAAASLQDAYTAVFNPAPPDTGSSAAPPDSPPDSQPDAAAVQRDQAARVPSASQASQTPPVLAFADGSVYATGESSTLGNYIMLQHAGGYITLYAHCSRVTASGGSVAMGDKIAEVGATGLATGPHLHFELHDGGLYLNPIFYVDVG